MFYALGAGTNAGIATSTGIAATFCAIYYAFKVLPLSSFWRLAGSGNVLRLPDKQMSNPVESGHVGTALSDLRPCGIVIIEGCRYSARSIDGYKSAGTDITVIDVRKNEIVVIEVRQ